MWITKSLVSSEASEKSLDKASGEANLTLYRVQPRLSREVKAKAHLCANSIANAVSLTLLVLSAKC